MWKCEKKDRKACLWGAIGWKVRGGVGRAAGGCPCGRSENRKGDRKKRKAHKGTPRNEWAYCFPGEGGEKNQSGKTKTLLRGEKKATERKAQDFRGGKREAISG